MPKAQSRQVLKDLLSLVKAYWKVIALAFLGLSVDFWKKQVNW
jgi:hypothetical protein